MSTNPIKIADRIKEISYTMGTGDLALAGAVAGFSSFLSAYSSGDSLFYAVTDGSQYEIGSGVFGSGYIVRFPTRSTNNNALVNFNEGIKEVYVTYPATNAVYMGSGLDGVDIPSSSGLAYWISPNMLGYDNDITWDSTNKRLGIKSINPEYAIDLGGSGPESIIKTSGIVIGNSGVYYPPINNGDNTYLGGRQLIHYEKNELDQKAVDLFLIGGLTGSSAVIELSGNVNQYILFKQQPAGTVFAGPPSGCTPPCDPGYPSFRLLTIEDVPALFEVSGILNEKITDSLAIANGNISALANVTNSKINTVSGITVALSGFLTPRIPGDGDKGDIVISSNGTVYTIDAASITTAKLANSSVTSQKLAFSNARIADGRLTTESSVPVSTGNRTSQSTIYYAPYVGNNISLYNTTSSAWETINFTQAQLSLVVATGNNYDVFGFNNNGVLALELSTAWTNSTTRSENLTLLNGVLVKSTNNSRRYLGTIRSTGTNTIEDSLSRRFVWNANNRVLRRVATFTSAASWTYGGAAWRNLNNESTCRVEIISGSNDPVIDLFGGVLITSAVVNAQIIYSLGMSKNAALPTTGTRYGVTNLAYHNHITAKFVDNTTVGYHFYAPQEYVENGNVQAPQLYGGNSSSYFAGIQGIWEC